MEQFRFKAANDAGVLEQGTLEARSKAEAYDALRLRKLRPISIEASASGSASDRASVPAASSVRKLSGSQLLLFTEELSELLDAGLQLDPALRVIESRKEESPVKTVAAHLRQQVRDGVSFSNALRNCGGCFSELYCSMAAAGEAAGALPQILRRQAEYFGIVNELQRRVIMALVYPSIVFGAGILLLVIFMTLLLPALTDLLRRTGKGMPAMTMMLINTSNFFAHYWWLLASIVALIAIGFAAWRRTPDGRATWDRTILRIPLIGPVLQGRFFAEFSKTLATLVANGVTLLNGLMLLERATPNLYIKALLKRLAERVGEGTSLTSAMRAVQFFPPVMLDMVTVGEQTGNLAGALERAAKRFDKEFSLRIQQMTNLIQPATIFVVALFVGVVAYSMITGIMSSVTSLQSPGR